MSETSFGSVTPGDTVAHQLTAIANDGAVALTFKARKANTGIITLGNDATVVAGTGFALAAGEVTPRMEILNPQLLWYISSVGADRLDWVLEKP